MKRWVTLFPFAEKVHLFKDVGQIPYFMTKHGWKAELVSSGNKHFTSEDTEANGLPVTILPGEKKLFFLKWNVLKFLLKQSRYIDVLHVFHLSRDTFIYGLLYKLLHPKGFLYLKLDAVNSAYFGSELKFSKVKWKNQLLNIIARLLVKKADLISIENTEGVILFRKHFPNCHRKLIYLPNGINVGSVEEKIGAIPRAEVKENIFLCISRMGEEVKNMEAVFSWLHKLDMKDWKIVFIGPETPAFLKQREEYFNSHPHLKENILFTGEIFERKKLYNWLFKAKVFFLPSREESFGLVLTEALWFGCYLIGTRGMSAFNDISRNGDYGIALDVNDPDSFPAIFSEIVHNTFYKIPDVEEIHKHAVNNFTWWQITLRLNNEINRRKKNTR